MADPEMVVSIPPDVTYVTVEQIDANGNQVKTGSFFKSYTPQLFGYELYMTYIGSGMDGEIVHLINQVNDLRTLTFQQLPKTYYYETWLNGTQMKKPVVKDYRYRISY